MFALNLILLASLLGADPPTPPETVYATVDKSLAFLEDEGLAWKQDRKCASCHHVLLMIWSFNEARRAGYTVNADVLSELTKYTLTDPAAKVFFETEPKPEPANQAAPRYAGLQLSSVYASLAVQSQPEWDEVSRDTWNRVARHASEKQAADGSWTGPNGRAPLFDQAESVTALGILTMIPPPAEAAKVADLTASRAKAIEWLAAKEPATLPHQALAMRLLAGVRLARPAEELKPLVDELGKRQKEDGGWSQTSEMASDAFATGQSLYVLKAAEIASDDSSIQRGVAFLVKTQIPEGNWPMTSRPVTGGDGAGAKNLGPITYAGTAWGVLGLVRAVPRK